MTREEKMRVFGYYLDEVVCVCGRVKKQRRWTCRDCKARNHGTGPGVALDDACARHVLQAQEYLALCQRNGWSPKKL